MSSGRSFGCSTGGSRLHRFGRRDVRRPIDDEPERALGACSQSSTTDLAKFGIDQLRHRQQQRRREGHDFILPDCKVRAHPHGAGRRPASTRPRDGVSDIWSPADGCAASASSAAAASAGGSCAAAYASDAPNAPQAGAAHRAALQVTRRQSSSDQPAQIDEPRRRQAVARLPRRIVARAPRGDSTDRRPGRCRSRRPAGRSPARSASSIAPRVSIVRYDRQRVASSTYGSTSAPVGHASRQSVHVPH